MKKLVYLMFIISFSLCYSEDITQKIEEVAEKLPQAKITENVIYVKPDMQIYIPNGAVDLKFKETYRNSVIIFKSKYDFVDSFMGFDLDIGYGMKPFTGVNLYDKVDFSEFFSKQETVYRVQTVAPYVKFKLSKISELNFSVGFENTLITSVETYTKIEHGNNVMSKLNFNIDTTKENTTHSKCKTFMLQIRYSVKPLGSDYDYANLELSFNDHLKIFKEQFLEYQLHTGYPLYSVKKPVSELYYLGGYKLLKGYKYKEFTSEAMLYNELKYNTPLAQTTKLHFLGITFAIVTWNVLFEIAKIGDKKIFTDFDNIKFSIGTGIDYNLTILKILPVKINFTIAQAIEYRTPQIHCTISTTYYTWKTE